jgi:hypothetical protein
MKPNNEGRTDWDAPLNRPKQTRWGDSVGGPGPVPLKPEARLVRIWAYITQEDRDRLLALGGGNISLGLRIAIGSSWLEQDEE